MASSPKCPDCGSISFWSMPNLVAGVEDARLVSCINCGKVVGVLPSEDLPKQVEALQAKVDWIVRKLNNG